MLIIQAMKDIGRMTSNMAMEEKSGKMGQAMRESIIRA